MIKDTSRIYKRFGFIVITALLALAAVSGSAMAATVNVNGIMEAGEYTGDNSGSIEAVWTNKHKHKETLSEGLSIYNDGSFTTTVYWEDDGTNLFLFMETPLYAKNMIWGEDVTDADILLYEGQYNTHHSDLNNLQPGDMGCVVGRNGNCKDSLDFKKATGSEGVQFGGYKKFSLDSDDVQGVGITMLTSLDWLLADVLSNCTSGVAGKCYADTTTMSFEFKLLLTGLQDGTSVALLADIAANGLGFHLSPEMRGPKVVPVPAALPLFISALAGLGFFGRRRKAKLAA